MKIKDSNESPAKVEDSFTEIGLLLEDYGLNSERHREVSRSLGLTFLVGIAGILAALFLNYLCPDARGPINSVLPCVVIALYVLLELMGLELMSRERYLALLEMRIRFLTGDEIPCWESRFRRIIYHTWRFEWLKRVVAAPAGIFYAICVWKAVPYLRTWHDTVSIPALVGYIVLPALVFWFIAGYRRDIVKELAELEKRLHSEKP
jgi:hypothetical protein